MQINTFDDRFYEAKKQLYLTEPFYSCIVDQIVIQISSQIDTISVYEKDSLFYIIYNQQWINSLTVPEAMGAIKHVIIHLIFDHLNVFSNEPRNKKNKLDIAQDLAVNTNLPRDNLPNGFIRPSRYKLPEGLSSAQYLNLLPDLKEEPENNGKDSSNKNGNGDEGKNGSKNESKDGDNDKQNNGQDEENKQDSNNSKSNGQQSQGDNHNFMHKSGNSGYEKQIQEMVQQAHKNAGNKKPSNWGSGAFSLLDFLLLPPEINWATILRRFVSFASRVSTLPTWKRPNRRLGELYRGKKKTQSLRIMVAIDESGSIGDNEWIKFMSEIESIRKNKKATITICKFTTKVEEVFEYNGVCDKSKKRYYGGTLFQPFLSLAESIKPDCILVFTDGENFEDHIRYSRPNSVLWCLTPTGKEHKEMGTTIKIKEIPTKPYYW